MPLLIWAAAVFCFCFVFFCGFFTLVDFEENIHQNSVWKHFVFFVFFSLKKLFLCRCWLWYIAADWKAADCRKKYCNFELQCFYLHVDFLNAKMERRTRWPRLRRCWGLTKDFQPHKTRIIWTLLHLPLSPEPVPFFADLFTGQEKDIRRRCIARNALKVVPARGALVSMFSPSLCAALLGQQHSGLL